MATDLRNKDDYYYDPAVMMNMADEMDKWNEELKQRKSKKDSEPLTGKEKRLERAWKSPYRMAIKGELEWRLEHPGCEDTPAKTRLKDEKWLDCYFFIKGAVILAAIVFVLVISSFESSGLKSFVFCFGSIILCSLYVWAYSKRMDTTDYDRDSEIYRYALDIYRDGTSEKFFAKFLHL